MPSLLLFWLSQPSWEVQWDVCVPSGSPGDAELLRPCLTHPELPELSSLGWVSPKSQPWKDSTHPWMEGRMDQGHGAVGVMLLWILPEVMGLCCTMSPSVVAVAP